MSDGKQKRGKASSASAPTTPAAHGRTPTKSGAPPKSPATNPPFPRPAHIGVRSALHKEGTIRKQKLQQELYVIAIIPRIFYHQCEKLTVKIQFGFWAGKSNTSAASKNLSQIGQGIACSFLFSIPCGTRCVHTNEVWITASITISYN